jgi:hypothetical protein
LSQCFSLKKRHAEDWEGSPVVECLSWLKEEGRKRGREGGDIQHGKEENYLFSADMTLHVKIPYKICILYKFSEFIELINAKVLQNTKSTCKNELHFCTPTVNNQEGN